MNQIYITTFHQNMFNGRFCQKSRGCLMVPVLWHLRILLLSFLSYCTMYAFAVEFQWSGETFFYFTINCLPAPCFTTSEHSPLENYFSFHFSLHVLLMNSLGALWSIQSHYSGCQAGAPPALLLCAKKSSGQVKERTSLLCGQNSDHPHRARAKELAAQWAVLCRNTKSSLK